MPDPLDYREAAANDPPKQRSATRRALTVGVTVLAVSVAILSLPLVISLGDLAKWIVTPAFIGACIGLSITANAAIDWWRGR